jgi:hypothetical protein
VVSPLDRVVGLPATPSAERHTDPSRQLTLNTPIGVPGRKPEGPH